MDVVAVGAARRRLARPADERRSVLPGRGRPHQRGDREAAGALLEQVPVPPPDVVLEWPLDMARHDGVALLTGHRGGLGRLLGAEAPDAGPAERMILSIVHTT